jgi:hypothetical protein
MNDLAVLLTSFNMEVLFKVAYAIADVVGKYLSPVLLLMAIYIRLMETQIDSLAGSGKYGTALKDILLWGFVLGAYYAIGALVMEFFNEIYAWLDTFGSLKSTMDTYSNIMQKNAKEMAASGITLTAVVSAPYNLIAMFLYYGSLIIVAFIAAFLKIANVMAFGIAFIWGLIAIPISISTTFKILRGWAYLLALALVWPIIQALLVAMFSMLFSNSADTLMQITDADPSLRAANIMMLFAVMNLLFAAILVSAPLIANTLVTNSSAASGIVMPFVAAAVAAGISTIKGRDARGSSSLSPALPASQMRPPGSLNVPTARMNAAKAAFASNDLSAASTAASTVAGSGATASLASSGERGGDSGAPNVAASAKKQQQRRGVVLTQIKKRKSSGGA